jgi:hypothetical protein
LITAGLLDDPRLMMSRLNKILTEAVAGKQTNANTETNTTTNTQAEKSHAKQEQATTQQ